MANLVSAPGSRSAYAPKWTLIALTVLLLLNVVFAIALLRWKRWGIYGLVVSTIVIFALNVVRGSNPAFCGLGTVVGIAVLLVLVNIGGDRRAWTQLE